MIQLVLPLSKFSLQYSKKNRFKPIFTPTLAKLTSANFFALYSERSLARGIDEMASKPTINANHIIYSEWFGYFNQSAMGWEKNEIIIIKNAEVVKRE